MLAFWSCLLMSFLARNAWSTELEYWEDDPDVTLQATQEALRHSQTGPVRDIDDDELSKKLLKNHRIYVALSATPRRLKLLRYVFMSLDLTRVHKILLFLPMRFRRDNSEYVIPDDLREFPKLEIVRLETDFGPATKILGPLRYLKMRDPFAYVVSIDDDQAYPRGMINEFIYHVARSPATAFAPVVLPMLKEVGPVHERSGMIEGYAGVIYPSWLVNPDMIEYIAVTLGDKHCFVSDDLVISYTLAIDMVKLKILLTEYVSSSLLKGLPSSRGPDGLFSGVGTDAPHGKYANWFKYDKCARAIAAALPDWVDSSTLALEHIAQTTLVAA